MLPALGVLALACILTGCKTIRAIREKPLRDPLVLTAAEAERYWKEGDDLYNRQPRTVENIRRAADRMDRAARALPGRYDAQWQAARALAFLAEYEKEPVKRRDAAEEGVVRGRKARELDAGKVEGHYWYAINVGLLADVDRSLGLNAVVEMESVLKRAIEIDEKHDYAGPLRVLGILYLRAPGPPISLGSTRKGLRLLERAVQLYPDYPENRLYLGEALRVFGQMDEARAQWEQVLKLPVCPDRQWENGQWRNEAQKMLGR